MGLIIGILLPFVGSMLGSACVFIIKNDISDTVKGCLSGFAADLIISTLPYLLFFAAGAMMYVVVEELIPEMASGEHSNSGTIAFTIGFTLRFVLDVVRG